MPTMKSRNEINESNEIKNQYQHLRNIPFCDINGDNVRLLIGTNYADLLIHQDFRVGYPRDPIAVKTVFVWMFVGGSKVMTKNSISCNSLLNTTLESLNENVKQFWQIDSYGTVPESQLISPNQKRSLELLEKTTKFVEAHFIVGLLQKGNFPILQNNANLLSNASNLLKNGSRKIQNSLTCTKVKLTIT